jgi:predicted RNA binding protein YcfA (HicA-like mRNA interferase family)
MSQFEKFKARVTQARLPKDITATELQSFMEKYGFVLSHKSGSHFSYKHISLDYIITIPMHSPIKHSYIAIVKDAILKIEGGSK